jgi:hypothetical protein
MTGDSAAFVLCFGLGIVLQSLVFVRRIAIIEPARLKNFRMVALSALVGLIPGKREYTYNLKFHVFLGAVIYAFAFGWYYRRSILAVINEQVVLQVMIITVYALSTVFGIKEYPSLYFPLCIPLSILIYTSFRETPLGFRSKLILYVWYLMLNIVLLLLYVLTNYSLWNYMHYGRGGVWIDEVLLGINGFFLIVNSLYLYQLIPFPGKHQSMKSRIREWKEFAGILTLQYRDIPSEALHTLVILVVQGGLLTANYFLHVLSPGIVIGLSVFLVQILTSFFHNTPPTENVSVSSRT